MHVLKLLKTLLLTKVFELTFVTDGSKKSFSARNILLTVTADLETFLVVLETLVGAELFDITSESNTILAKTGGRHLLIAGGTVGHLHLVVGQTRLVAEGHGLPNDGLKQVVDGLLTEVTTLVSLLVAVTILS